MKGDGVKKGSVFVETADKRPCKTIKNPIKIAEAHQTIYHTLGIKPETQFEIEKRTFYTIPYGEDKAVGELLV